MVTSWWCGASGLELRPVLLHLIDRIGDTETPCSQVVTHSGYLTYLTVNYN
jgi:hypothetical protein